MRKTLISFIMLTIAANIAAQDFLNNSEINSQWRQKTISVKNGGQTPDVVKLLRAFNEVMPTWTVSQVLKQADHPAKGTRQSGTAVIWDGEEEDDYRILIDRRNGYADLASQTDIDQTAAGVWRKDNGHRIFALSLFQQHANPQNVLCWYDYDPQTQTMTPDKSPLEDFKPSAKGAFVAYDLPMTGTDFNITEYYPNLPAITHVYKWNRKQFLYNGVQMPDFEYRLAPDSKSATRISQSGHAFSHYSLLDPTDSGNPMMAFCNFVDGEVGDMMLIGDFKGNHVALGQKTQDGEKLNLFYAPENKNGDQQIAVVYRDMAGGLWYHIMLGNLVQYLVCDLPNFANPEKGHTVEITAGYGSDDETTEVINLLGDWIDIMKRCQWSKVDIQEGEEEMP
jgi:hypothetical protein